MESNEIDKIVYKIIDKAEECDKGFARQSLHPILTGGIMGAIKEEITPLFEEITILREQLRGTREELAEARKQREEAMKWETDQKFMKSLADENTRLKGIAKSSFSEGFKAAIDSLTAAHESVKEKLNQKE